MANITHTPMEGLGWEQQTPFEKFGWYLEGIDVTSQNLDNFTPYVRGVSRIFMHKTPQFLTNGFATKTKVFKTYVETAFTAVDGISDVNVTFVDYEGGFNGQRFSIPGMAQDDTESITISVYELQGSPVREYLDLWINGVRDQRSGIAHYHNMLNNSPYSVSGVTPEELLPYKESNHTAEFVYCTLDPTALRPEYVAMFAHAFPTKIPRNHLNYEKGTRAEAQIDMEFRCTKYESPAINELGSWYLTNSKVKYNYLDFDPNLYGTGGRGAYTYDYGTANLDDPNQHTYTP